MMLKPQNGMLYQIKKFKKNKGLSLIEALVAIIVVGIGIVSVLQLSMYAVITADNAIVKNKANFLAEMMAEDILADRTNVKNYSQVFTCNLGQSSSQDQAGLVKDKWNSNFQNILGKNNCTAKDIKQSSINNLDSSININLHLSEGKQKKYLGIKVK